MTKDDALKLALEVLKRIDEVTPTAMAKLVIPEIEQVLAQPEQEPVGLIESLKDAKPCCGEYETCWRACTPRGKFLGQRDAQRTWDAWSGNHMGHIEEVLHEMTKKEKQ